MSFDDLNALSISWPSKKPGFNMFSEQAAAKASIVGLIPSDSPSPLSPISLTNDLINSDSSDSDTTSSDFISVASFEPIAFEFALSFASVLSAFFSSAISVA